MQVTFSRTVVGSLALLGALAAGCSSHSATHHSPPPTHHSSAPSTGGGIPQNGGGDHDADNSGGPSDGDGNL